jgi:hypothetical protein
VGAIAGGAVGGALAFASIIILVIFCLRRRKQQNIHHAPAQEQPPPISPGMRSVADMSSAYAGSTLHSPNLHIPPYSPKSSPHHYHTSSMPYGSSPDFSGSEWAQQDDIHHTWGHVTAGQQTYYPPPPDPSHSPRGPSELPSVRSPAYPTEMPDVRSPVPIGGYGGHG